jgi:hypothetical protein
MNLPKEFTLVVFVVIIILAAIGALFGNADALLGWFPWR